MECISNITLLVDEHRHGDPVKLSRILDPYSPKKTGSCYRISGTFEELDLLVSCLSHHSVLHQTESEVNQISLGPHHAVSVPWVVMDFIQKKQAEKLQKIHGKAFILNVQRERKKSSVLVSFKSTDPVNMTRLNFVSQRFITFCQRTLSDLQQSSIQLNTSLGSDPLEVLSRRFPHLLFKPGQNPYQATVIGPFYCITVVQAELKAGLQTDSQAGLSDQAGVLHPSDEDACPICMEPMERKATLRCRHSFCQICLDQAYKLKPVCPVCGAVYGLVIGQQPSGGTMKVQTQPTSLPGHKGHGTIVICYHIPDGIQTKEHPEPGAPYKGTTRTAYLPDSPDGRAILDLLRRAFKQKLVFTIGLSRTSGRSNTVTWNDIHHKTSPHGGPVQYGYPDPEYLDRVREELKAKGIE